MEEDRKLPAWALPVAGVVAVVALVAIGLSRTPTDLDPETPEGTVQAYIEALVDGDFEAAASFWADTDCHPESPVPTGGAPDVSASLVRSEPNGDDARVVVQITENSQDPLRGIFEYEEWFSLIREGGSWRIRQPAWPYYDQMCEVSA
ncbi:MAG: hypothetical protein ACRDZM_03080 [Acidimicrobiia bacterium]